jgi:hypothetical protein
VRYLRSVAQLTFQRARTEEKKRQRAAAIVEAARSLAFDTSLASVTLTGEQAIRIANRPITPPVELGEFGWSLMTGPAGWKIGENRPQAGDRDRSEARGPH